MRTEQTTVTKLLSDYEVALTECGLGYSSRLRMLHRASLITHRHERRGVEYFDQEIVAECLHEIDQRFYSGVCSKQRNQLLHREIDRFVWFAETGELKLPNPTKGCRQKLTPKYQEIAEAFLAKEMHPSTRNDARWIAHKYFSWLEEQGYKDLSRARAEQIQMFLLDCSGRMAMNTMHDVKVYIKKLYAYLYEAGLSESSYHALLSFKVNRESKIFPALPKADIAKMLEVIDRATAQGKRAYAAMMLDTVLGLRACDVVNLKLTDIDWINGEIKILQSKTSKSVILPLTEDVGEALKDYILNARPPTDSKQIFMRLRPPYRALQSAVTIGEIYWECCKSAGLLANKRFHSLRRSLGTSMVNAGVPVSTAAQVFGDTRIDSMKPYIAVDSQHLKLCALSFDKIEVIGGGLR